MAKPWKDVAGGMLTTVVRVFMPTSVISDSGGEIPGPPVVVLDEVPASIEPVEVSTQLREALVGGQLTSPVTHLVRMRRAAGREITTEMYFVELQDPERELEVIVRREDVLANEMQFICKEREAVD